MTQSPPPSHPASERVPVIPGTRLILLVLIPLTVLGGLGFMLLGPVVTAKHPGSLHVGIRFNDEMSVQFIDKNVANPLTRLEILPAGEAGAPLRTLENLRRGKNVLELSTLPDGLYRLRFTSPGYAPLEVVMEKTDGEFRDTPKKEVPEGSRVLDQFVGVELQDNTNR